MKFDKVICLVLDKRIGDWPRIRGDCLKHDLLVEPFFCGNGKDLTRTLYDHIDIEPPTRNKDSYPAFKERPNSYNAFLCFKKIIQRAKDTLIQSGPFNPGRPLETLLLLEDDIRFLPNYEHILSSATQNLPSDWELFYLGCNTKFSKFTEIAPNLIRVNGAGCFHAVCLRNTVFDEILALPIENPIDGLVAKKIHPRNTSYAVSPNIIGVNPGWSYCENRKIDYSEYGL